MIEENRDAWTLFAFGQRRKTWGMISLDGEYHAMSRTISDRDGGWWNTAKKGYGVDNHVEHPGKVVSTVDIMVLSSPDGSINKSKILLIQRGKEPFKGAWAFPGGRIEQKDTDILISAQRELKEETNLDCDLDYFTTVGNNHRDPRGFCLTNVFVSRLSGIPNSVRAGDDAVNYEWFSLNQLPEMAFDHREILDKYLDKEN
jgi:8-oxo-dGTP diphosphatase